MARRKYGRQGRAGAGCSSIIFIFLISIPLGIALIITGHYRRYKSSQNSKLVPSSSGYGYTLGSSGANLNYLIPDQCLVSETPSCSSRYVKKSGSSKSEWLYVCSAKLTYEFKNHLATRSDYVGVTTFYNRTTVEFYIQEDYPFRINTGDTVVCYSDLYRPNLINLKPYRHPEIKGYVGMIASGWIILVVGTCLWVIVFVILALLMPKVFCKCCPTWVALTGAGRVPTNTNPSAMQTVVAATVLSQEKEQPTYVTTTPSPVVQQQQYSPAPTAYNPNNQQPHGYQPEPYWGPTSATTYPAPQTTPYPLPQFGTNEGYNYYSSNPTTTYGGYNPESATPYNPNIPPPEINYSSDGNSVHPPNNPYQ